MTTTQKTQRTRTAWVIKHPQTITKYLGWDGHTVKWTAAVALATQFCRSCDALYMFDQGGGFAEGWEIVERQIPCD